MYSGQFPSLNGSIEAENPCNPVGGRLKMMEDWSYLLIRQPRLQSLALIKISQFFLLWKFFSTALVYMSALSWILVGWKICCMCVPYRIYTAVRIYRSSEYFIYNMYVLYGFETQSRDVLWDIHARKGSQPLWKGHGIARLCSIYKNHIYISIYKKAGKKSRDDQ